MSTYCIVQPLNVGMLVIAGISVSLFMGACIINHGGLILPRY